VNRWSIAERLGLYAVIVAIIGVILAFFALVNEQKRCDLSRRFNSDILCPPATLTLEPGILYEDDFEDGTANGWDILRGKWDVIDDGTGNRALVTSGPIAGISATAGNNWDDYNLSFKYRFSDVSSSSNFLIWLRRLDNAQYYELVIGTDYYELWKYVDGTGTQLDDGNHFGSFLSEDQWHTVVIEASDNTLKWQVDNEARFVADDSSHRMGTVGFGTYNFDGQVWIDDVSVRP
jgi:hypothetical protein